MDWQPPLITGSRAIALSCPILLSIATVTYKLLQMCTGKKANT